MPPKSLRAFQKTPCICFQVASHQSVQNLITGRIDFLLSPQKHPNTQSHWLKFRCACAKCGILEFHPGREKCGRPSTWQAGAAGREHCFFCPFRRRYTGAYVSESNLHVRTQVMCNAIFVCRYFADIDFIHCSGNETKELEISTQSVATTQGQQRARCGFSSIHLFLRKRLSSRLHTPLFDANERRPSANSRQINARAAI
jgi:hypothetical protein